MRTTDGDLRTIRVQDRKGSDSKAPPWRRGLKTREWLDLTGKEPSRDHLLVVWREGPEQNRLFLVPFDRVPYLWGHDLPNLGDLYLDLEHEDGTPDDLTRLLGLVCVAVGASRQYGSITYRGVTWPLGEVSGLWTRYQVTPEKVSSARVGFVLCTGTRAPPAEEEEEEDDDWD